MELHKQTSRGNIKVTIMENERSGSPEETINIIAKIENNGVVAVAINHRQVVNYPSCPRGMGDLLLLLQGPDSYQNLTRRSVNPRRLNENDWKPLEPGEVLTKEISIDKLYSLHQPGPYQVQVAFDNRNFQDSDYGKRELLYSNIISININ